MANVYVRSGAAGAGTGADWANAFTTLAAALTAKAAGDSFWVSEDHAETQASAITLTSPGTAPIPCFIYCVNHLGSVPPVSADLRTTATISTTGNSVMNFNGFAYFYGITFNLGDGANNPQFQMLSGAANGWLYFYLCAFVKLATTPIANAWQLGASNNTFSRKIVFDNTTIKVANINDAMSVRSTAFVWRNTAGAIVGATKPSNLFSDSASMGGDVVLEAVDLSALGSNTILAQMTAPKKYYFKDCKLGASATITATPTSPGAGEAYVTRSDSGATNYRAEKYTYTGTETTETTVVRTGGATDGTTSQSRKLATTANSRWVLPYEALPLVIWNNTVTGNVTITVQGTINAGAVPNNDDIWIVAEYLGSALTPIGSYSTDTKADNLASGTALAASSSAWGGGGSGPGWSPFVMSTTFAAPAQTGPITVYVYAAKASTTYYVDPLATLS